MNELTVLVAKGIGMISATTRRELGRAATIWSTSWARRPEVPVNIWVMSFVPMCKRTMFGESLKAFAVVAIPAIWLTVQPGCPSLFGGNGMPATVAGPLD